MSYPIPPGGFSPDRPPPPGYRPPPPGWQHRPPGSIKVLGILNLVFSGLGAIGMAFTYSMYFSGDGRMFGVRNPVVEIAHDSPGFMSYLRWSLLIGTVALGVFFASGLGLIKVRAWGRKLAILYAAFGIVSAIVGLVATQHYVLGPLSEQHSATAGAGSMGGYMGGVLGVVYPTILLIFMFKRNVRDHFARVAEPVPQARVVS